MATMSSYDPRTTSLALPNYLAALLLTTSMPITTNITTYMLDGCGRCPQFATDGCKVRPWQDVLYALREILLASGLEEVMKWGVPCYVRNGKNVLTLGAAKAYVAIGFFKGILVPDLHGLLQLPGENSYSSRVLKFTSLAQVEAEQEQIIDYIQEAIRVEDAGLKIPPNPNEPDMPEEFADALEHDAPMRQAFYALTPGKRRGYLLHFSGAKQSPTRVARIEKCREKIMKGEGLQDGYGR